MRVFLAHPKGLAQIELNHMKHELGKVIEKDLPGVPFEIVLGKDDFESMAGIGWNNWQQSVLTRRDPSNNFYFHTFIVPGEGDRATVGKVTFEIVMGAIEQGRTAWIFNMAERKIDKITSGFKFPDPTYKSWGELHTLGVQP